MLPKPKRVLSFKMGINTTITGNIVYVSTALAGKRSGGDTGINVEGRLSAALSEKDNDDDYFRAEPQPLRRCHQPLRAGAALRGFGLGAGAAGCGTAVRTTANS